MVRYSLHSLDEMESNGIIPLALLILGVVFVPLHDPSLDLLIHLISEALRELYSKLSSGLKGNLTIMKGSKE